MILRARLLRPLLLVAMVLMAHGSVRAETVPDTRVVVTYFHRTLRCHTCLLIEGLAQFDVTNVLADEMDAGHLEWLLQNIDDEKNAAVVDLYDLESPSLVVALVQGEEILKWSRLDRIWDLSEDVEAFDAYVLGTVKRYLQEAAAGQTGHSPADK